MVKKERPVTKAIHCDGLEWYRDPQFVSYKLGKDAKRIWGTVQPVDQRVYIHPEKDLDYKAEGYEVVQVWDSQIE